MYSTYRYTIPVTTIYFVNSVTEFTKFCDVELPQCKGKEEEEESKTRNFSPIGSGLQKCGEMKKDVVVSLRLRYLMNI